MTLYRYIKDSPVRCRRSKQNRGISLLFMTVGGGLLLWAIWPIISFALTSDMIFPHTVSPISPVAFAASIPTTGSTSLTNANLWYPTTPQKHIAAPVNTYTLSIPKLHIENALVTISGDDLEDSLVHYGGTGIPGQYGTAVIFGHSSLPQFYSPKRYESIFSLLPSLTEGDEMFVTYDGIQYRYEVHSMEVVEPTDLSVLEQQFDNSSLTLVTCVPPGTLWKRLKVHAVLTQ